jgi:hypothetical protein
MLKWLGYTMDKNYKKDIIEYNSYKMLGIQIVAITFTAVTAYYFSLTVKMIFLSICLSLPALHLFFYTGCPKAQRPGI